MLRLRFAGLLVAGVTALSAPALAETRIIVVNNSDGYGIDQCLAAGESCGAAAASALCRSRQFARAERFGRVDRKEITGGLPKEFEVAYCAGRGCPEIVAITCSR